MSSKKSESTNTKNFENAIANTFKAFAVLIQITWHGIKRVNWKSIYLYEAHLIPLICILATITRSNFHLQIWQRLFPNLFTPWKVEQFLQIHWGYYFVFYFIVVNAIALLFLGIRPYKEKNLFQHGIDNLGLKTALGIKPKIVKVIETGEFKKKLLIRSEGISPGQYEKRMEDLQSSFAWIIDSVKRSKNSKFVEIDLTEKALPTMVPFNEHLGMIKKPYHFVVGESLGGPIVQSLVDLPHLLIAGATGGGKSVFLNNVLMSLLKKSNQLQLYMIDLKGGVELQLYEDFPNVKVDKEISDAVLTLRAVKKEMERRFAYLEKKGFRKIDPVRDKLDRIVVAVDECADIYGKVSRSSNDYDSIIEAKEITDQIAKKGRASGIHLILATQRVSTETIDSRIKANIPGKMCFQMTTIPDSQLVLGNKKAFDLEEVEGRAYWSFGTTLIKVQAPFIDEKEVKNEAQVAKFEFEENNVSNMVGTMINSENTQITINRDDF